jgi:glutamate synthase (NADPH/NADH) large chain
MEPWDGPAAVAFTDGTVIGAVLDRNGLRPARYWVTDDGLVVLASEVGVLDIDPAPGRAQGPAAAGPDVPGRHAQGRIVDDDEIKAELAAEHPYGEWLAGQSTSTTCPRGHAHPQHASVVTHQRLFGYTTRSSASSSAPRWPTGAEPIGSMGNRHADRGAVGAARGCSTTTSPSCSPR